MKILKFNESYIEKLPNVGSISLSDSKNLKSEDITEVYSSDRRFYIINNNWETLEISSRDILRGKVRNVNSRFQYILIISPNSVDIIEKLVGTLLEYVIAMEHDIKLRFDQLRHVANVKSHG